MTIDSDSTAEPPSPARLPTGFDSDNRQAATIGDSARDYLNRLRGGDMGSLPAILGLIVLFVVFSIASDTFLTELNIANLITQAGAICVLAMGLVFVLLLGDIDLSAGFTGATLVPPSWRLMIRDQGLGWPGRCWPASPPAR